MKPRKLNSRTNRRALGLGLVLLLLAGALILVFAQGENPFRQPGERVHADNLINEFNIQRSSYISQDILQDLALFFTTGQLAIIWDACAENGGSVTNWNQLKNREGLGETTLWKLYVFFDLEGSISDTSQ